MNCARCGNEVFRTSARSGELSFHCARCGLAHPLQPAAVGTRIEPEPSDPHLDTPEVA
jgi:hypothetical protein